MTTVVTPKFQFTFEMVSVSTYHANAGEGLPRHSHAVDHSTMCCSGKCVIRKEGKELIIDKNSQPVLLTRGEWHEIEAIEDGTVFINIIKIQN